MFDTTKHFSEGAIRKRNQERLKLQQLEEERKKEKKREEEVAERKRKDEERKAQEKRKKARVRRRALKEMGNHRQRRQKVKTKAEVPQELDSSEEWEERKYLLAQRRVEALRLLHVLLRKISVRLSSNCSSIWGSTQFYLKEVDITGSEASHTPGNTLETWEKEELNAQHLQNQEEMPEYQVAKSDNKQKRKMRKRTRNRLHKSSHYLGGKKLRYSTRKERTRKLLTDKHNYSLVSDPNSLQITVIQGQSLENEEHHSAHKSCSSRLSERDHGRKQKIYETDEFIDYLLNYYQTPKYSRVFLEASQKTNTCQWQRDVHVKGNGFQISLRKQRHPSTDLSQMENLERREDIQEDDHWSTGRMQDPEHKSQKRGKVDYTKECTKRFKSDCKDTASEAGDQLFPTDAEWHLLEKTHTHQASDSKSTRRHQISSPFRSVGLDLKLTDFLEEISSDSECFSEIVSINEEEKEESVATYHSSPEEGTLDNDEIIACKQKSSSSHQTLHSEWKHDGKEKYSKYKLRTPGKRSKYEPRCSWLEDESSSIRDEKNNSKKREKLTSSYLFEEDYYHEFSSSDQLEEITRKKRRVSGSILDRKVNCRPSHVPTPSSKSANDLYLGYYPKRRESSWKSEYNRDARRLKKHENSKDFMLNSDNYYIRHNSNKHIDCGSYLGNSYTSSLYFQMF